MQLTRLHPFFFLFPGSRPKDFPGEIYPKTHRFRPKSTLSGRNLLIFPRFRPKSLLLLSFQAFPLAKKPVIQVLFPPLLFPSFPLYFPSFCTFFKSFYDFSPFFSSLFTFLCIFAATLLNELFMNFRYLTIICIFACLFNVLSSSAQQLQRFSVAEFVQDPMDLTARNDQYKRTDDDGKLYSIIKVKSNSADDDLQAYRFDFGLMNSFVVHHPEAEELWVYVQKNAKTVSISREGYISVNKYDLRTTIDAGRTYKMLLSVSGPQVYLQMVLFRVKPTTAKAVVMVKSEHQNAVEEMFGIVDENGAVAKSLPFGSYTYRVAAENFYQSEGRFTLNNQEENHVEEVTLRGNFGNITLKVESDAVIYVDGERKGTRSWTGALKAGSHQVECRQTNHKPSLQAITIADNETRTIALPRPTPITGSLSITSHPLGAKIKIDGQDYGQTPKNITGLIVGKHTVELTSLDHEDAKQDFEIQENQTTQIEANLSTTTLTNDNSNPTTATVNSTLSEEDREFTVKGHGKTITFKMKYVKAGVFQMGGYDGLPKVPEEHTVTLTRDYYIGENEISQGLWFAVMGQSPTQDGPQWQEAYGIGDSYPAYNVSFEDCQRFINNLNHILGVEFRLPTEAEWEFAAKGGTKTEKRSYEKIESVREAAWFKDNSNDCSHPIAYKSANELGLHDMLGNVCEWCADWYEDWKAEWNGHSYIHPDPATDPTGPIKGEFKVIHGGAWMSDYIYCSPAFRHLDKPQTRSKAIGFRLAL